MTDPDPADQPEVTGDLRECRNHTDAPSGYLAWHEWAEKKARTHDQFRCPGCGLFKIWRKRAV